MSDMRTLCLSCGARGDARYEFHHAPHCPIVWRAVEPTWRDAWVFAALVPAIILVAGLIFA